GRPLDWYRRVRELSRPSLSRARALLRRLRATPPAPAAFAPPPAFAILPRRGDSVEPEIMRAHIRAAATSVAPPITPAHPPHLRRPRSQLAQRRAARPPRRR